ncbi:SPOSA6832_03839, partial [Sporobolomyces salmonicolor]
MSAPVTGNFVIESAVVDAPLATVWHKIKLNDFSSFWTALKSSGPAPKGVSEEADVHEWVFKPALSYTSVISTITLHAVTTGAHANSTFIEWTGQFSSDADVSVIEDAKYKRREALADLAKAVKA